MTLPLAGPLDYQPFAASLTSAGPFTMETPHHSPPTASHYRATAASTGPGSAHRCLGVSELTHRLLLKLIWVQSLEPATIDWKPEGPIPLYNQIGLLVWRYHVLTYADRSSEIELTESTAVASSTAPLQCHTPYCTQRRNTDAQPLSWTHWAEGDKGSDCKVNTECGEINKMAQLNQKKEVICLDKIFVRAVFRHLDIFSRCANF